MTDNQLDGHDVRHRAPKERAALGKAARANAPRSSHAEFAPGPKRPDPLKIIEKQSATRLPGLVPIRYSRMSESPFRFYRGPPPSWRPISRTPPQRGCAPNCAVTPTC